MISEVGAVVQQVEKRLVNKLAEMATNRLVFVESYQVDSKRAVINQKPDGLFPSKNVLF